MSKQKFQIPELRKFNDRLRERAEHFLGLVQQDTSHGIRFRHTIGKEAKCMQEKNLQKTAGLNGDRETYYYGVSDPLEQIGLVIDNNRAYLTDAARFATAITDAQLDLMCSPSPATGRTMGWGHVREILSLVNAEDRDKMIRMCQAQGWTIADLQEEIQKSIPAGKARNTRKGAGRQPVPPGTVTAWFQTANTHAGDLKARIPVLTDPKHSLSTMVQAEAKDLTVPELQDLITKAENSRVLVTETLNDMHLLKAELSQSISVLSQQLERLTKPAPIGEPDEADAVTV